MDIVIEVVRITLSLLISILHVAMFIRAIFSWFPMGENKFSQFLYALTEPVIYPVRRIFEALNIGVGLPIDIPFFVTFLLLSVINMFI